MSNPKVANKYDYKLIPAKQNKKGTILFIHGYCVDYSYFVCADRFPNYDVWMVNLPGHGNNTVPPDKKIYKKQLTIDNITNFVVNFINDNQLQNIILIGHSMGGAIASFVYKLIPDKIQKIILISPANFASVYAAILFLKNFFPKNMEEKMNLQKILYHDISKPQNDQKWVNMIQTQFDFQQTNWKQMKYLGVSQLGSVKNLFKMRSAQKSIDIPFLLCLGVYDRIIPYKHTKKLFEKQYKNKPNFQLVTFNQSAHLCFEEETNQFLDVVNKFLQN